MGIWRWLTGALAVVVGCAAIVMVILNHLPGRRPAAPVVQLASAEPPVVAAEAAPPPIAQDQPLLPEPPKADDAQTATARQAPPAPGLDKSDARLAPLRKVTKKARKPRAKGDTREPSVAFHLPPDAAAHDEAAAALASGRRTYHPDEFETDPRVVARQALGFVGADPDAEAVWLEAINDPSRTAHERQDLIEDLNEEGFADPKRPTVEELPLIANRLALIEELAGDAMDDVNAAAFAEAYKDLVNMYMRLSAEADAQAAAEGEAQAEAEAQAAQQSAPAGQF